MANKVVIDIEARLLDKVSGAAKTTAKNIENIGNSANTARTKLVQLDKQKVSPKSARTIADF